MRDFFIRGFELLLGISIVLMAILIVVLAGFVAFYGGNGGMMMNGEPMQGGLGAGFVVLFIGLVYLVFVGGIMYLGLGIYQNTRRTAEAVEKLANNAR